MTETNSAEVPTASLVGALSVFPLNDILGLLSGTDQRGELQVVGQGVDGHLWINGKDLVGATLDGANTLTQAVFELMLLDEGWFYFTSDQVPPAGSFKNESVSSVIGEVVPQVQEWRDLLARVPLGSVVRLARTTPGPEVQIRSDQWKVLTAVGTNGRTVGSVVEELEDDSVVTVRLLRELVESGLIEIESSTSANSGATTGAGVTNLSGNPYPSESAQGAPAPVRVDEPIASVPTESRNDMATVPPPPPGFVTSSNPVVNDAREYSAENEPIPVVAPPTAADPWAPPGSRSVGSSSGRY